MDEFKKADLFGKYNYYEWLDKERKNDRKISRKLYMKIKCFLRREEHLKYMKKRRKLIKEGKWKPKLKGVKKCI